MVEKKFICIQMLYASCCKWAAASSLARNLAGNRLYDASITASSGFYLYTWWAQLAPSANKGKFC